MIHDHDNLITDEEGVGAILPCLAFSSPGTVLEIAGPGLEPGSPWPGSHVMLRHVRG